MSTLEEALYVVEFKDHGAEFYINPEDPDELCMRVWVFDTDDEEQDQPLVPLVARIPVDPDMPGEDQIRRLIHQFLCHEADERLYFNGERPFFPEHPLVRKRIDA